MVDLSNINVERAPSFAELEERASIMPHVDPEKQTAPEEEGEQLDGPAKSHALKQRYRYRRAYSECELLDALGTEGFHFEKGTSYNFMTRGDVDALSYLKAVLRQQDIERLLLSTWCVAPEDVKQFRLWLDQGRIGRMDVWLGEIYRGTGGRHGVTVANMREAFQGLDNVTVQAGRNHAKVMAGRGQRFDFVILTSANINTNPRIESAVVQIPDSPDVVDFYENFFSTVKAI